VTPPVTPVVPADPPPQEEQEAAEDMEAGFHRRDEGSHTLDTDTQEPEPVQV